MERIKLHKKITIAQNSRQQQLTLDNIKDRIHKKMVQQYSTSQDYFYKKSIENVMESKSIFIIDRPGESSCVYLADIKFNDEIEHIQKYYKNGQSYQQLPELLQYYKYYSQDSICFLSDEFSFMTVYHEKKKAVLYDQLKKQLNISDSQVQIQQISKKRISQKYENVLSGLETTQNNDESFLVNQILRKLVNHYGPSRIKTIGKLDCEFKFMAHNLNMNKNKVQGKQGPSLFNPHTMLESTNTSVRNNPFMKTKISKNPTHRRFQSCQVPKSAYMKAKQKEKEKQKKGGQKIRRRKSTELISYFDSNTIMLHSMQKYKKQSLKTEQQVRGAKANLGHIHLKQKMEKIRLKIRKQKQMLLKKSQSAICGSRKKLKK